MRTVVETQELARMTGDVSLVREGITGHGCIEKRHFV